MNRFMNDRQAAHVVKYINSPEALLSAKEKYRNDARSLAMRSPRIRAAVRAREQRQSHEEREYELQCLLSALIDGAATLRLT